MQYDTLKLNKDFRRLYGRGKSKVHPALVTYVMKNRAGYCRIGITTSKKIGCAVERNRARRVILAAWRELCPAVPNGYDLVFVARARTPGVKSTELVKAMRRQFEALGVLGGANGHRPCGDKKNRGAQNRPESCRQEMGRCEGQGPDGNRP